MSIKTVAIFILTIAMHHGFAQMTDVSLYLKKDKDNYLSEIESESGNMFNKLGHHGPAIENPWYGLRIYFNKKMAIDVYSKSKPGLELKETRWYPTKEQQRQGWGADYYKVGNTVGLGGIKLWDGEEIIPLNPVTMRSAKVENKNGRAIMEVLSKGVPYKGKTVDILVTLTVFEDDRMAVFEANTVDGTFVQFVTGINYHLKTKVKIDDDHISTWGIHPEDVALEKVEVGAAIIFSKHDFMDQMDDGEQHLLVSKPTDKLKIGISSCNARESEMNSSAAFETYLSGCEL